MLVPASIEVGVFVVQESHHSRESSSGHLDVKTCRIMMTLSLIDDWDVRGILVGLHQHVDAK